MPLAPKLGFVALYIVIAKLFQILAKPQILFFFIFFQIDNYPTAFEIGMVSFE